MNNNKDYSSGSDSSDEDFCPENAAECSSDEDIEDNNFDHIEETDIRAKKQRKGKATKTKSKSNSPQNDVETKRTVRSSGKTDRNNYHEKDEIESDDDEKARAEALWSDFLGDVKETPHDIKKSESTTNTMKTVANSEAKIDIPSNKTPKVLDDGLSSKKVTVTEILDFAGEEIHIEKVISSDSIKENKSAPSGRALGTSLKRPAVASSSSGGFGGGGGGLGSLLNQIGKKKKISVLEKTKLDWNSFKKDEGIEEELQTFNKGKNGFLERQDFLERTDLRQFEIERNLRQSRRNH